jgi:hypothetical protein
MYISALPFVSMTTLRIKIKLAEHELEAEGPPDIVQAQILTFARLLGRDITAETNTTSAAEVTAPSPATPPAINRIGHLDGKVVSANLQGESLDRAVLVLLLGQHVLRGNGAVAGSEVMQGLRASGLDVQRADHVLRKHAISGHLVVTGKRRLKRYRLTTDGMRKAEMIAQALAASAPASA